MTAQGVGPYVVALQEHRLEDGRTIPRGWLGRDTSGAPAQFTVQFGVDGLSVTVVNSGASGKAEAA